MGPRNAAMLSTTESTSAAVTAGVQLLAQNIMGTYDSDPVSWSCICYPVFQSCNQN